MAIYRAFKTEWDASLNDKSQSRQKATPKPAVVTKASAIDPTRRYKQNRSLGLAAVVSSQLVNDDEVDQVQAVQSEGASIAVPIVAKPFEGEGEKSPEAEAKTSSKPKSLPEVSARSFSASIPKSVAPKAQTNRSASISASKNTKPVVPQAMAAKPAQATSIKSAPTKSDKPAKHVPILPTAASTLPKASKKKVKTAAAATASGKSGNQGNWWEEGDF